MKNKYFCFLDSSLEESRYSDFSYFCIKPDFWIKSDDLINKKKYIKNKQKYFNLYAKHVYKKNHKTEITKQY